MAVIGAWLASVGSQGTLQLSGSRQFNAVYHAQTNDPLDQSHVVIAHFASTPALPFLGSQYTFGNDADLLAFCNRISARLMGGSRTTWRVELQYKELDDEDEDEDEEPTDDPLEFAPELSEAGSQFTQPVWEATIRSGFAGNAAQFWAPGSDIPVINSAGVVMDPPPERDHTRKLIRLKKNVAEVDSAALPNDQVNSTAFTIDYRGYKLAVGQYQAKLQNWSTTHGRKNNVRFWELSCEMHIDLGDGWREEYPDRGLAARAAAGDPDGRGGIISPSDLVEGRPQIRQLTDSAGQPITEPILLDGDGGPLAFGADTVWLQYSLYKEVDFTAGKIGEFLAPFLAAP